MPKDEWWETVKRETAIAALVGFGITAVIMARRWCGLLLGTEGLELLTGGILVGNLEKNVAARFKKEQEDE